MSLVVDCSVCPLPGLAVLGEGSGNSGGICLLGEALGETEAEQLRPFVGAAGSRKLRPALASIGLTPEWTGNMIPKRPPGNRTPRQSEVKLCWETHMRRLVELLQPRLIVAVGSVASRWLTGVGVEDGHGRCYPYRHSPDGMPLVYLMWHPAAALRGRRDKRGRSVEALFRADIQILSRVVAGEVVLARDGYRIDSSVQPNEELT